jgi:CSLREA domain-containing protein
MKSHTATINLSRESTGKGRKWLLLAEIALLALPAVGLLVLSHDLIAGDPVAPQSAIFVVNTTSDIVVDGACANGLADCSLRGAIQAANSQPGTDDIEFDLPAGSVINLTQALPDLSEGVNITGPGANVLTVRRDTGGDYGIFDVTTTGTVAFSGLTISNGNAPSGGGGAGIANSTSGTVNVTNCTISGNFASNNGAGGGIFTQIGTVNVTNCTISGNSAVNGGGIFNGGGTVTITNTSIFGNSALTGSTFAQGGGIFSGSGGVTITNSTISGNSASFAGGGIHTDSGGVTITNSTISGNGAGGGGGINNGDTVVTARSTIIALNLTATTGPDVNGALTSQGFNLIGNNSGATIFTPRRSDQIGTAGSPIDPLLGPLQDNGGPTFTHALLLRSPAIDQGTSNGLTTDQRGAGFPRTFDVPRIRNVRGGDGTDVGAFELRRAR